MKLHAVLIDDEYNGLRSLELLIRKFVPELKIVGLTTNPEEGIEFINTYRPDIVFLDINMPALSGFELLEKIEFNKFSLIFTTAHQEYAIKAIKKAASDYLLKPIDVNELLVAIEKVKQRQEDETRQIDVYQTLKEIVGFRNLRIPVPVKGSVDYVLPSAIVYIEANSNATKVLLSNMTLLHVNKSLKEYESLLCKEGLFFLRVHNSFIINLNHVTRYIKEEGGQVMLLGNKIIPVSKNKKEEFFKILNFKDEV